METENPLNNNYFLLISGSVCSVLMAKDTGFIAKTKGRPNGPPFCFTIDLFV
jgi:hypothetical protein